MCHFDCFSIDYKTTHRFSNLIVDYLNEHPALIPFFSHKLTDEGFLQAINERQQFDTPRNELVKALEQQYNSSEYSEKVLPLIQQLNDSNTFTITTAHQTNLLLGPAYLIYKVMHTIVLSNYLSQKYPQYNFLPVYYMGSEDNDWEELDHFYFESKKYQWKTSQSGAFGSAIIDKSLIHLIEEFKNDANQSEAIHHQLLLQYIDQSYILGRSIAEANKSLIHHIFKGEDLIILDGNDKILKNSFIPIMQDDLEHHTAANIVDNTTSKIEQHYKTQAHVRPINLFYLSQELRERIEIEDQYYKVINTPLKWNKKELLNLLHNAPQSFSPNVILRPLYQEWILPNIGFIGGGSEVAYWMQLKDLFSHYQIPFPVLVLRQSVEMIDAQYQGALNELNLSLKDLFLSTSTLVQRKAHDELPEHLNLDQLKTKINNEFSQLSTSIKDFQETLLYSMGAVHHKINHQIEVLQKKLYRAQRQKLVDYEAAVSNLQHSIFTYGLGLSERKESFMKYYNIMGDAWLKMLKEQTDPIGKKFLVTFYKNNS